MNYNFKKQLNYINWKEEAEHIVLSQEEFSKLYKKLKKTSGKVISGKGKKTLRSNYEPGDYRVEKIGVIKTIYLFADYGKYIRYTTNCSDDVKNNVKTRLTGPKAISTFIKKFNELNKITFNKAFGTVEDDIKSCIPKQFYYKNYGLLNKKLIASSIDACSHYPSNMKGLLPDSRTAISVKGYVSPTEEYPFAFYPDSGNVAEYGKYDTREWISTAMFYYMFDDPDRACKRDDKTILMKASKYQLDNVWEYFYEKRNDDPVNKLVMNATIGMMHMKKYTKYKYAHLVAIALARANDKHLKMMEEIGINNIIHVCVDGIIYKGTTEYGVHQKGLSLYEQEFTGCDVKVSNSNCYIAMKDNKVVKAKHGAFNFNKDGTPIDLSKINNLDDQYNWIKLIPEEIKDEEL